MESANEVFALIGQIIIAGGGGALVSFGILRSFSERWLDSKLQRSLEAFRHEHAKEIEHLRLRVNGVLDRTTKLNQKEFEVLPEAWQLMVDAKLKVEAFIDNLQTYPNLDGMSDVQIKEFLNSQPIHDWDKDHIRVSVNKTKAYIKVILPHYYESCKNSHSKFYFHLIKKGIFIPRSLNAKFLSLSDLIWNALVEGFHNRQYNLNIMEECKTKLEEEGPDLLKEIEEEIYERLWGPSEMK